MSVRIDEIEGTTDKAVQRMLALRERVYAADEAYCPPFEGTLERGLRQPVYAAGQRIFVARRPGEDVACAVVRRPEKLQLEGQSVATIGDFEALDDREAVTQLLSHAAQWALEQGSQVVIGPMNGDTWHRYRWSLGPRDEPPFLMEPYNPSYYPELWEQAGFEILQTYHSRRVDDLEEVARRHRPRWAEARALGYRIEPMTKGTFDAALDRVYEMVRDIFADGFLYTPMRRNSFKKLYDGADAILDGRLSFFLVDRHGEDAGFAFVFPDYAQAVAAMNGDQTLWAKAKFLMRRRTDTANIKTIGIMPEHRGQGLSSAMAHKYFDAIATAGYERANICLIHDENEGSIKIDGGLGRVLRRYALYQWAG